MQPLASLTDSNMVIVADTSTIINLLATGQVREILKAIPNRFAVAENILFELEADKRRDRQAAKHLEKLVSDNVIDVIALSPSSATLFEDLVIGIATETLDDGEAATIAVAAEYGGIALIDERKANRICRERFPDLKTGCTVDLFTHAAVQAALGERHVKSALLNALKLARMRVLPHHLAWVRSFLGEEHVASCNSLPKSAR